MAIGAQKVPKAIVVYHGVLLAQKKYDFCVELALLNYNEAD